MHIELNDEQKLLRDEVRRFAEEVVRPIAKEIDAKGIFPRDTIRQAAEMGLTGVAVPEEYGGSGMDTISYCLIIEEISRVCASTGVILSVNNSLVCEPILKWGNEEQKKKLAQARSHRGRGAGMLSRLTEPGAGSDAASVAGHVGGARRRRLRAERQQGVHHQRHRRRHRDLVFATVDPKSQAQGASPPSSCPRTPPATATVLHEYKLGVNASGTTELAFENMRVPVSSAPGRKKATGSKIAMATLDGGRVGIAAQAVGIAQGAFEEAVAYAQEREQFGTLDLQLSRRSSTTSRTCRPSSTPDDLLTWKAAWTKENRKRCTLEAAQAKLFASEMAQKVTNKALQIHGGYGYIREYNVERYFRDARITEIYEGTSEIQKLVISDWVLNKS